MSAPLGSRRCTAWRMAAMMALLGPSLTSALDRQHAHSRLRAPLPLRLKGGTDIKWTPGDDKPNAPFSKRARDAQARAEGRDPDAPPPEGWSLVTLFTGLANAISQYPREAATLFAAAMAGCSMMRLRNKIRQDWPIPIRSQGPHMTWLRPQGRYLKGTILPQIRALQLDSSRDTPITSALKTDGKLGQGVPGYSVFTNRVKVGAGAEDAMEACNAVKAWRMADAVDGLSAIVSRKPVADSGGAGDSVVLLHRTRLGYISVPWRVTHCDSPSDLEKAFKHGSGAVGGEEEGAAAVGGEAEGAAEIKQDPVEYPVVWQMVCGALQGSPYEGELSFRVEMLKDGGSLSRLLRSSLAGMAGKTRGILETQKEMRQAREFRLKQVEQSNDEARAQSMAEQVRKQQDKLNLEPKQLKRGNIK